MMGSEQIAHLLFLLVPEKAHRQNMVSLACLLRVHIVIDGEEEVQKGPPPFNRFHKIPTRHQVNISVIVAGGS